MILDYLANTLKIRSFYSQFQTTASIEDVRPFIWKGFTAHPLYTYLIPIQDNLEEIKKGFSQSERRYLNRAINDKDIAIETGTEEDLVKVNNAVKKRYESQGIRYSVPDDYLRDVYKYFKEEIFIAKLTHKGEFMSGMIYVKNNNMLSF